MKIQLYRGRDLLETISIKPLPCAAKQRSDQMRCDRCGLVWDMNDLAPPVCPQTPPEFVVYRGRLFQHVAAGDYQQRGYTEVC